MSATSTTAPDQDAEIIDAEIVEENTAPDWDGTYKVTTETSSYLIDFTNMTATRMPGDGGGCLPGLPEATVSTLRKDTEPIPMLRVPNPVVGERMELWLAIREDGTPTYRPTTYVRSIEPITTAPLPGPQISDASHPDQEITA